MQSLPPFPGTPLGSCVLDWRLEVISRASRPSQRSEGPGGVIPLPRGHLNSELSSLITSVPTLLSGFCHWNTCSPPSRRWVSPPDRRCPQHPHSRRALHPEPAAAGAAAGAGAVVAAPGRLRQPPGSGGWAPGAEKLPPHPSPSSHSLEGKTKAERRLGSGARRLLSGPWHAWLAEEGPPRARPPSCHPSPALPAARLRRCGASGPGSP